MGKCFVFYRIKLNLCSWLYRKRWHISRKFPLEITNNTKVIAKQPLTNLYEINSRSNYMVRLFTRMISTRFKIVKNVFEQCTVVTWKSGRKYCSFILMRSCLSGCSNPLWNKYTLETVVVAGLILIGSGCLVENQYMYDTDRLVRQLSDWLLTQLAMCFVGSRTDLSLFFPQASILISKR